MPISTDGLDRWEAGDIYVVGHRRPDTDAIASALGYAWYLTQTGHKDVVATRCGQPGDQANFALRRFHVPPPRLLTAVAPTFGHLAEPRQAVSPDTHLSEAFQRLANGEHVIPVVDDDRKPLGVVTALSLARAFSKAIYGQDPGGETCGEIAVRAITFQDRDRISDHRNALMRNDESDFVIVDGQGQYVGMTTQRQVLDPPRARLILVDHNELSQAVIGADEAEIVAVLDHHRLANAPTSVPILFVIEPVGSTSTLVAEHCREHGLEPPDGISGMLLSGILSDTMAFRSPTTTDRDHDAGQWLADLAGVDLEKYGEELLMSAPSLSARTTEDILDTDRKSYQMGGEWISIAQAEVTDMQELPQRREELLADLEERRQRESLALACLMITDVVTGRSVMLAEGEPRLLAALPFSRRRDKEYDLGDIVSRKKELVPALSAVLEQAR